MIRDEVSDKKPPQYTLDLHVNKEDKKYHLHVYNTPEYGSKCHLKLLDKENKLHPCIFLNPSFCLCLSLSLSR